MKFAVPGVSCQHCVNAVTQEVTAISGVSEVLVDLTDRTVTVAAADSVSREAVIAAIVEAGYDEVAELAA